MKTCHNDMPAEYSCNCSAYDKKAGGEIKSDLVWGIA